MVAAWYDLANWNWITIWAAVQALGTVGAASAIIYAVKQLRFNVWLELQKKWNDEEQRRLRRALFERRERHNSSWTSQEKQDANNVCGRMDEFARLLRFTNRKKIVEIWYVPVAKLWDVLKEIVREEQENHPDKWSGFVQFADDCVTRRMKDSKQSVSQMS